MIDPKGSYSCTSKSVFYVVIFCFEIIVVGFLAGFFHFHPLVEIGSDTDSNTEQNEIDKQDLTPAEKDMAKSYGIFQDLCVMVFIGFGLFYTYLKSHSWSSIGVTFFIAAIAVQWGLLTQAFWHAVFLNNWETIDFNIKCLTEAEYAATAVIITLGSVIGKLSMAQYFFMAIIEIVFYSLNYGICIDTLETVDAGGSMTIFTFGAIFGLFMTWVLFYNDSEAESIKNSSSYINKILSFIGVAFLWVYWPSFNTALLENRNRYRGILCTHLSIVGSCVAAFMMSAFIHGGKFRIEDILRASISGGIVMGGPSSAVEYPFCSIIIGFCTGAVTTLGIKYLGYCQSSARLFDTTNVMSFVGIPGILGGIFTSILCASYSLSDSSQDHYETVFPGLAYRSPNEQGGLQIASLFVSIGIAMFGGLLTGLILKGTGGCMCAINNYYDDSNYWVDNDEEQCLQKKRKQVVQVDFDNTNRTFNQQNDNSVRK